VLLGLSHCVYHFTFVVSVDTLSRLDALPICPPPSTWTPRRTAPWRAASPRSRWCCWTTPTGCSHSPPGPGSRVGAARRGCPAATSEKHTSELQSREKNVCRLLLEKKKKPKYK